MSVYFGCCMQVHTAYSNTAHSNNTSGLVLIYAEWPKWTCVASHKSDKRPRIDVEAGYNVAQRRCVARQHGITFAIA